MIVEVAARKFAMPIECPCCGAVPDGELTVALTATAGRRVAPDTARGLEFPYCKRCIDHVGAWEAAGLVSAGVTVAAIVAGVLLAIFVHVLVGLAVVIAGAAGAWVLLQRSKARARTRCGPSCTGPARAVTYLGWSGADSAFAFDSHAYAARFAEQNADRIANPSAQLRRLLEANRAARLAVPTPAVPQVTVPPPATVADWLARLDETTGVVGRRATVARALDALHEPADREQLIARAVELELAALELRTKPDRDRAIAALRADNLPDELQVAVLQALQRTD